MRPLPADHYVDPSVYAAERRAIFGRDWLVLGALAAIPEGHAMATTVAGLPVVVRRDNGEHVQGFVNVCTHRAGPLVWDGETEPCPRFRCKYHGWQFAPDGRLLRTPGFGADPPDTALSVVHLRVWRGLIFGCFADEPPALEPRLDALEAGAGELDWTHWQLGSVASHTLACNWKNYVENYLEGYHIPYIHPSLSREVDIDTYEVGVDEHVIRHIVVSDADAVYSGFWALIWPNTAINVYQGGLSLERIVPTGPQTMRIDYTYLFDPTATEAERDAAIAMSTAVTAEDKAMCEAVQRNLASGLYSPGWLSPRHETGVGAFQDWVRRAMQGQMSDAIRE